MINKFLQKKIIGFYIIISLSFTNCSKSTYDNANLQSVDPENIPYCKDYTSILGTQALGISRAFEVYCRELNFNFMTVFIPELDDQNIQNKAVEIFENFRVGEKKDGRGILLLVSRKENSIKFEVGYNLENIFTDAFCGYLSHNSIRALIDPDPTKVILKLNGIILALNSRMNIAKNKYEYEIVHSWEKVGFKGKYSHISGGAGAKQKLNNMVDSYTELLTEKQRYLFTAGDTPKQTLDVFIQVLRLIIKDPYLDIYSDATKILRCTQDWDFYSSVKFLFSLEKCRPFKITIHGRFAVAKPTSEQNSGWPFFLVQGIDGKWRLDEVRLIQNCIIDKNGILKVSTRCKDGYNFINDPYIFAYNGTADEIEQQQKLALEIEDINLFNQINHYDSLINNSPDDWKLYWKLSQLYLFCNSIEMAYPLIDKVMLLKSDDFAMFEEAAFIIRDYNFMFAKVLRWYQKAYDLGSRSYRTLESLGFLYGYFKDGKKAEKYLNKLTKLYISSRKKPYTKILYALAYFYQGNIKKSQNYILSAKNGLSSSTYDYFSRVMGPESE